MGQTGDARARPGEIYFEHQVIGGSIKVSAIDADTGTEVSIVGPATASQRHLETVALNKLRFVMKSRS